MHVNQREKLRKERNRSRRRRRFASPNRQSFDLRREIEVCHGQRVRLRDANAGETQQPHGDAVVVGAIDVQERAVLVGAQEIVRALRARRRG